MIDRLAVLLVDLVGWVEDRVAAFVVWLQGEQVVTRYVAAAAVTALANRGIHLSPEATYVVALVAAAVAAWATRRKVWKRSSVVAHGEASYVAGKTKQSRPKLS